MQRFWVCLGSRSVLVSFSPSQMAPGGEKILVLKPAFLKRRGYYFKTCRRYQSDEGIFFDYRLYNKRGWKLKLQPQGWRRLLSYNFSVAPLKASGLQHRRFFAQRRHCAEEKKTPLIRFEPKMAPWPASTCIKGPTDVYVFPPLFI